MVFYYNKIIDFTFQPHPYTITLAPGHYKFEAWGASGMNFQPCSGQSVILPANGRGAYTSGIISLKEARTFYVYVGQTGSRPTTFNSEPNEITSSVPGGGATDFRTQGAGDEWSNFLSLKTRIMVAAGGGAGDCSSGGDAGGLEGFQADKISNSMISPTPGNQTSGGSPGSSHGLSGKPGRFGISGSGSCGVGCDGASSGGSGYYGGGGMAYNGGGAGGSSFISGHPGCLAIQENAQTEEELKPSDDSIHYSGLYFNFTQMKAGNEEMPVISCSKFGNYTMIGNTGNGHARITFLDPFVQVKGIDLSSIISLRTLLFISIVK